MIASLAAVAVLVGAAFVGGMAAENYRIQRGIAEAFAGAGDELEADTSGLDETGDETPADDAPTQDAPTSDPADEYEDSDEEETDEVAAFDQTFTYEDGLQVSVSAPVKFSKSEYAAGGESSEFFRKFTVTITNGTDSAFDPSSSTTSMTAAGVEGDEIYDDTMGGAPETRVLPGKSVSYEVGYGLDSKEDIVVQVTPGYDYSASLFQ